jgi:hypothetical protein
MAWTTVDGVRLWLDDASGLAQLRDRSGTIRQVNPAEAVRQMVAFDFAPATPDDVHAYDQAKRAGGAGRAAATGAVAGALDVAAGAASLYPSMLTAAGKPALRAYLRSQGKSEAEIDAALAKAAPYEPQRIVREALGGREVMENVAAVGAEALGGEGEAAAKQWRQTEQATAAEHPIASVAGYAGGQIAATLALPGVGGAIRGAGIGGRVLLGAAEGTALGAATAGEDAYIKDHELTAEHLLAGAGVGGVLGGGLVLGLHGAGRIWQRIGTRGVTGIDAAVPEALSARTRPMPETGTRAPTKTAAPDLAALRKAEQEANLRYTNAAIRLSDDEAYLLSGPPIIIPGQRVGSRQEIPEAIYQYKLATQRATGASLERVSAVRDALKEWQDAHAALSNANRSIQKAASVTPIVPLDTGSAGSAMREMAENVLGQAPAKGTVGLWRSILDKGTELYEKGAGIITGKGPEAVRRVGLRDVMARGEESAIARWENRAATREAVSRELHDELGNLHSSLERVTSENVLEAHKGVNIAPLVESTKEAFARQRLAVYKDWERIRDAAQAMADDPTTYGTRAQTRGFVEHVSNVGKQIAKAQSGADLYVAEDMLKRRVQRFSLSARRASVGNVQGWLAGPQAEAVANRLDQIQEPTRQLLMDAGVWGQKAATAQREINAAWENLLGDKVKGIPGTHETFSRNFFDVTPGVDYATGRPAFIPSAQKVAGFVGRMGRFEAEAVEENLNRQIAAADRMADTITREYGLKGAAAADANTVRSAAGKIRELLAKHKDDLRTFAEIDDLLAAEGGGLGGVGTGALGGGMLGGPGFAAAGALLGGMAKPISTARTVRAAMALAGNVKSQLRGDVASVVTSRTPRRLLPATGTVLAPAAATVGARYSLEERQDRWRKQAEIVQASANPAELQERITQALGTLPRDMPATAGMVAAKSSSIAAYLQERLGPMIPPQSPLQPNLPVRPIGRSDMAKWEGIWQAATNPRSVLVAWKAGRVTKDQVDTLRSCWPRLFADLQQDAAERIGQLKEPLTYAQRRSIDQLLGLGGLAEPTLSPGFLARTEERNQARLQVQQNRPAPKAAPSLENIYSRTKEIT